MSTEKQPLCSICGETPGAHHMGGQEHTFTPEWMRGDEAWLAHNDCFGTRRAVTIVRTYKAGTVLVRDDNSKRTEVNHVKNLSFRTP